MASDLKVSNYRGLLYTCFSLFCIGIGVVVVIKNNLQSFIIPSYYSALFQYEKSPRSTFNYHLISVIGMWDAMWQAEQRDWLDILCGMVALLLPSIDHELSAQECSRHELRLPAV